MASQSSAPKPADFIFRASNFFSQAAVGAGGAAAMYIGLMPTRPFTAAIIGLGGAAISIIGGGALAARPQFGRRSVTVSQATVLAAVVGLAGLAYTNPDVAARDAKMIAHREFVSQCTADGGQIGTLENKGPGCFRPVAGSTALEFESEHSRR